MSMGNLTPPISSCMYSTVYWTEKDYWFECRDEQRDSLYTDQVTAPFIEQSGIENEDNHKTGDIVKNRKNQRCYKHVPHKDKPAQVVAKRNARERRRVQAVNSAFARLRKAVPIENSRGKRVSKVKTLQYAIDYIYKLQKLLENDWDQPRFCYNYTDYLNSYNNQF